MQQIVSSLSYQELEIRALREEICKSWSKFRIEGKTERYEQEAVKYFLEMSSKEIEEVYLTHHIAYRYCQERATRELGEPVREKNG